MDKKTKEELTGAQLIQLAEALFPAEAAAKVRNLVAENSDMRSVMKTVCDLTYNGEKDLKIRIRDLRMYLTDRGAFATYGEKAPDFHAGVNKLVDSATASFNSVMKQLEDLGTDLANLKLVSSRIP